MGAWTARLDSQNLTASTHGVSLIPAAVKTIFDESVYGDYAETVSTYQKMIGERPSVRRTLDDRKAVLKAREEAKKNG